MNSVFGVICWLSVSGSLLALLLIAARRAFGHKLPPACFYYLWLIVMLRLLLPLNSPLPTVTVDIPLTPVDPFTLFAEKPLATPELEITPPPAEEVIPVANLQPNSPSITIMDVLPVLWLSGAIILALYSLISYLLFRRALRQNSQEINHLEILRLYQHSGDTLGIKKLPALWVSDSIPAPMQVGLFSPVLLLPQSVVSQQYDDLHYFLLHELVHYQRRDVFYKWLFQLCACLHWFNPLVYVIKRELRALCELSCDAKVLQALGAGQRLDYGRMLLTAVETTVTGRPARLYGVSWNTEVKTMKVRLKHIMSYEKQRKPLWLLLVALTMLLAACGTVSGPVKAPAAPAPLPATLPAPAVLVTPSVSTEEHNLDSYTERMLLVLKGDAEIKVSYDGQTWEPYDDTLEAQDWKWFTYNEYKESAVKALAMMDTNNLTAEYKEQARSRYVQTLLDINNGIKVAKVKLIYLWNSNQHSQTLEYIGGTINWRCFGYTFKDQAGNDVDLGLFETRDQLFASLKQYYDQEIAAGRLTQTEADGLYNRLAHSTREADEVPIQEKLAKSETSQRKTRK